MDSYYIVPFVVTARGVDLPQVHQALADMTEAELSKFQTEPMSPEEIENDGRNELA